MNFKVCKRLKIDGKIREIDSSIELDETDPATKELFDKGSISDPDYEPEAEAESSTDDPDDETNVRPEDQDVVKQHIIDAIESIGGDSRPTVDQVNGLLDGWQANDMELVQIWNELQADLAKQRPENEAEAKQAIVDVINSLDKEDKTKWTNNGKPDARVLTELLGWEVSAKERDAIYEEMEKASKS